MKGLVIRSPWIDLILTGNKTWEMRTRPTSIRGRIALIKAGSGLIVGTAELVECLPALTHERMTETQHYHAIPEAQIEGAMKNSWTTPWVLDDVVRMESPLPYVHPSGAVTWVELPELPITISRREVKAEMNTKNNSEKPQTAPQRITPMPKSVLLQTAAWVDIKLTEGNIRNGHFYLRAAEHLLPADCFGGSSKAQAGTSIRVRFEPGSMVETDIASDKMILRSRGQVRDFFERSGAKAGDCVRFNRTGTHDFVVTLERATDTAG